MTETQHQYIDRTTGSVKTEPLIFDRTIQFLYSTLRENAPFMFNRVISSHTSTLLGFFNYDFFLKNWRVTPHEVFEHLGADPDETIEPVECLNTYRKIFERQIRYWETRPMNVSADTVVSPADSRVLTGSFDQTSALFIKNKFFDFSSLLGRDKSQWQEAFESGDFAVFRLTPDKYHYNHTPVSGVVEDLYDIDGDFHSCNPGAVVRAVTPYSLNRRSVTVINTDVPGGTHIGHVAMVEIVALMIGGIVQCYSPSGYHPELDIQRGLFMEKGQPKSLFRPGSSTTVLIFEKQRINFSTDLLKNQNRRDVSSRFTQGFEKPLVETDIQVRQPLATAR
ncbi:MAG: phosphatidylserine decarboxylase [Desulfobacteraceae bacterium]|nr:MAG: phosphatidylserine decarboxylase [Desulfobacteraceae bacterium]